LQSCKETSKTTLTQAKQQKATEKATKDDKRKTYQEK